MDGQCFDLRVRKLSFEQESDRHAFLSGSRVGRASMVRRWLTIATVASWVVVATATQADSGDDYETPPEALKHYVKLVEELGVRRRVNVLFPNPQSLFDGLPVGFVNTTTGNLTFARRDIVATAKGGLVIFARVYDSRIEDNVDFGPGWRLSLAEEVLTETGGSYLYLDGSGTAHRFVGSETGYIVSPTTPQHNRTRLSVVGEMAVMREADGTVRTFERFLGSGRYQIASVSTDQHTLAFRYEDGLLTTVKADEEILFQLYRDPYEGHKIIAVTDHHGRLVRYEYVGGRLHNVHDLAGNVWGHEYTSMGLLAAAEDARGQPYLEVTFDEFGRVTHSHTARKRAFTYAETNTTVVEKGGEKYTFQRNSIGATTTVESSTSLIWEIEFDDSNRVSELARRDGIFAYTYNSSGDVSTVTETGIDRETSYELTYDNQRRLMSIRSPEAGSDGKENILNILYGSGDVRVSGRGIALEYKLSPSGSITWMRDDNDTIVADYDSNGDLAKLESGERSVSFERNSLGRIIAISYPMGLKTQYAHDDLGNRKLVDYGPGGTTTYEHDLGGNIVRVLLRNASGDTQSQRLDPGTMNRIERIAYEGWLSVDIEYDEMGRPVTFRRLPDDGSTSPMPSETVRIAYMASGGIAKIESLTTGMSWAPKASLLIGSTDAISDPRAEILGREPQNMPHPDYGVVEFGESTFEAAPVTPLELGLPRFRAAISLRSLASELLSSRQASAIVEFEKASNPVFQPPEYRFTNCCIPCIGGGCECWETPPLFSDDLCGCSTIFDYFAAITYYLFGPEEEEEQRKCRPCSPPVGTKMYRKDNRHFGEPGQPRGNHGVRGDVHYHHYEVHQQPVDGAEPCKCFVSGGRASDSIYPGEIPYQEPSGGGVAE